MRPRIHWLGANCVACARIHSCSASTSQELTGRQAGAFEGLFVLIGSFTCVGLFALVPPSPFRRPYP
ncbi:hypothetical protein GCM10023159_19320 [Brevibacterium yomogidense]